MALIDLIKSIAEVNGVPGELVKRMIEENIHLVSVKKVSQEEMQKMLHDQQESQSGGKTEKNESNHPQWQYHRHAKRIH